VNVRRRSARRDMDCGMDCPDAGEVQYPNVQLEASREVHHRPHHQPVFDAQVLVLHLLPASSSAVRRWRGARVARCTPGGPGHTLARESGSGAWTCHPKRSSTTLPLVLPCEDRGRRGALCTGSTCDGGRTVGPASPGHRSDAASDSHRRKTPSAFRPRYHRWGARGWWSQAWYSALAAGAF
jgi:hypothetical protein